MYRFSSLNTYCKIFENNYIPITFNLQPERCVSWKFLKFVHYTTQRLFALIVSWNYAIESNAWFGWGTTLFCNQTSLLRQNFWCIALSHSSTGLGSTNDLSWKFENGKPKCPNIYSSQCMIFYKVYWQMNPLSKKCKPKRFENIIPTLYFAYHTSNIDGIVDKVEG